MSIEIVTDIPRIAEILAACDRATQAERDLIADLALLHAIAIRGVNASPTLDASALAHHKSPATVAEMVRLRLSDVHPSSREERDRTSVAALKIWARQLGRALHYATYYLIDHLEEHARAAFFMDVIHFEPDILRDEYEAYHRRLADILSTEAILVRINRPDDGITPITPIAA